MSNVEVINSMTYGNNEICAKEQVENTVLCRDPTLIESATNNDKGILTYQLA